MAIYCYLCSMKERINWIDWAKALAVITVVFCHLPQSQEWFYYRYLQTCIITIFFFLSGYLKKDHGSDKENWKKYWRGLIIPYFIYNAIVYPYWFAKYYLQHGGMPDFLSAMRPIFGALLFQHENAYCEPLDGPLWYLPAVLVMHIIVDLCKKTRFQHFVMIVLCIVSYFVYAANKQYNFLPNLTFIGIISRLPFYYIGYLVGQKKPSFSHNSKYDILIFISMMILGVIIFNWHMQTFHSGDHMLHIALFYPTNLCFLFGVLYGCKLTDSIKLDIVTNLSIGTLVIIGLHAPVVSLINYAFEHFLHIEGVICYHWYEALPVAMVIVAALYPIIFFGKKHASILLGKKKA